MTSNTLQSQLTLCEQSLRRFRLIYFNWWKRWKRINDKVKIKDNPPKNLIKNKRSANSFLISLKSRRVWLVFTEDLSNKWDLSAPLQHCPIRVQEQLRVSFFFFFASNIDFGWVPHQKVVRISITAGDQSGRDEGWTKKSARRRQARNKTAGGPRSLGVRGVTYQESPLGKQVVWNGESLTVKDQRICGFKSAKRCLHILLFSFFTLKNNKKSSLKTPCSRSNNP